MYGPILDRFARQAQEVHASKGTEYRWLIYQNLSTREYAYLDSAKLTATSATMDVALNVIANGNPYALVADLHSHHVMSSEFSGQDDKDDVIKGILYGVVSWGKGEIKWSLRVLENGKFRLPRKGEIPR